MTFKPKDREIAKNEMYRKDVMDILQYHARCFLGSELCWLR